MPTIQELESKRDAVLQEMRAIRPKISEIKGCEGNRIVY